MLDTTAPLPETVAALDDLRNGPPPAPPRFRLHPPQYQVVYLQGDYAGAWAEMLLNPGLALLRDLQTTAGICARLHELVRAWNLDDAHGEPLPVSPAGVAHIDPDLSAALMAAWSTAREVSKSHR